MRARSRKARFLAAAVAKLMLMTAIAAGPEQPAPPVKTADAVAMRPPTVTRVMPPRDVQAWILAARAGEALSEGTSIAKPGNGHPGNQGAEKASDPL